MPHTPACLCRPYDTWHSLSLALACFTEQRVSFERQSISLVSQLASEAGNGLESCMWGLLVYNHHLIKQRGFSWGIVFSGAILKLVAFLLWCFRGMYYIPTVGCCLPCWSGGTKVAKWLGNTYFIHACIHIYIITDSFTNVIMRGRGKFHLGLSQ